MEIKEIKERLEKTSKGDWKFGVDGTLHSTETHHHIIYVNGNGGVSMKYVDMTFVENAKKDMAFLISEVERLTQQLEVEKEVEREIEAEVEKEMDLEEDLERGVYSLLGLNLFSYDEAIPVDGEVSYTDIRSPLHLLERFEGMVISITDENEFIVYNGPDIVETMYLQDIPEFRKIMGVHLQRMN